MNLNAFLFFFLFVIPLCAFSQGKWTAKYDENGKLIKEERYEQGLIEEKIYRIDTLFYTNHQPSQAGESIIHKKNFKKIDSIPFGKWEFWAEDGELIREEYYSNGKLTKINELKKITGNLVMNPGFEEHGAINCLATNNRNFFDAVMQNWKSANMFMPVIYDTTECRQSPMFYYVMDSLSPKSGKAVISILLFNTEPQPMRSYVQGQLKASLTKGKEYLYEMWLLRNQFTGYAANNLGIYFSETPVFENKKALFEIKPDIVVREIIETKGNEWFKISGRFKAPRYAKYLIIGNFFDNSKTSSKQIRNKRSVEECNYCKTSAVYFLDDVSVKAVIDSVVKPKNQTGEESNDTLKISSDFLFDSIQPANGKTFILKSVVFDQGTSLLLESSFNELDSLVAFMNKNPDISIEILGHTDNTGQEKKNKELSESRAKAVINYMIDSNIAEARLSYKGYGSSKPIDINTSENGRANNRRIEFKILTE